jgi:hypothetical protein
MKRRVDEDDATFGARCYRERLRREISMHTGAGRSTLPAPRWLRRARARYLFERATGSSPPGDWDIERIVGTLVAMAYPLKEEADG